MLANAYKNFLKDSNVKFVVEKKIQSRIIGSVQSFLKMLMIEQIFWNWLMKKNVMCRPVWKSINDNEMYKNQKLLN